VGAAETGGTCDFSAEGAVDGVAVQAVNKSTKAKIKTVLFIFLPR
jgi:hypothetical protein